MSQTNKNTEDQIIKLSKLAVTSATLVILSFCSLILMPFLLRQETKELAATIPLMAGVLMLVSFVLGIATVIKTKSRKVKSRGNELAVVMTILATIGLLYSLLAIYGYIRWERTGNSTTGGQSYSSPNEQYLAYSKVGFVRDFWGDWKDFYSFTIYETEPAKVKYHVGIDKMEPFDKKCFFPNGLGKVVRRGGKEDWEAHWSSDSSEVTFSFQEIELKFKIEKDNEQEKGTRSP